MEDEDIEALQLESVEGVSWAHIGGESQGLHRPDCLAVDGIDNVIKVLDDLENGKIEQIDFLEANACTGGCLGGPLQVENPFNAYTRMKKVLRRNQDPRYRHEVLDADYSDISVMAEKELEEAPTLKLSDDFEEAMRLMKVRDELFDRLPHLDCGACGAPTCYAFAQDVVRGKLVEEDCIIMLKETLRQSK